MAEVVRISLSRTPLFRHFHSVGHPSELSSPLPANVSCTPPTNQVPPSSSGLARVAALCNDRRVSVHSAAAGGFSSISDDSSDEFLQGRVPYVSPYTSLTESPSDSEVLHSQRLAAELLARLARATREGEARAAADAVVDYIPEDSRKPLLQALFAAGGGKTSMLFSMADMNEDGVLDVKEFSNFLEATRAANADDAAIRPLLPHELGQLFWKAAVGNVGFGITDNMIMIAAGDLIEASLGATFGFSTLLSAGLGNTISDIVGTVSKEYIEEASSRFMPEIQVSSFQLASKPARLAELTGSCFGITAGCLVGLTPLLFLRSGDSTSTSPGSAGGSPSAPAGPPAAHRTGTVERTPTMARTRFGVEELGSSYSRELVGHSLQVLGIRGEQEPADAQGHCGAPLDGSAWSPALSRLAVSRSDTATALHSRVEVARGEQLLQGESIDYSNASHMATAGSAVHGGELVPADWTKTVGTSSHTAAAVASVLAPSYTPAQAQSRDMFWPFILFSSLVVLRRMWRLASSMAQTTPQGNF